MTLEKFYRFEKPPLRGFRKKKITFVLRGEEGVFETITDRKEQGKHKSLEKKEQNHEKTRC